MGFNLGASNNTGKLNMSDFLGDEQAVQNDEKEIPINLLVRGKISRSRCTATSK